MGEVVAIDGCGFARFLLSGMWFRKDFLEYGLHFFLFFYTIHRIEFCKMNLTFEKRDATIL